MGSEETDCNLCLPLNLQLRTKHVCRQLYSYIEKKMTHGYVYWYVKTEERHLPHLKQGWLGKPSQCKWNLNWILRDKQGLTKAAGEGYKEKGKENLPEKEQYEDQEA